MTSSSTGTAALVEVAAEQWDPLLEEIGYVPKEKYTRAPEILAVRAMIEQWNRHAELELLIPISQVFRNTNKFWVGRIKQAPENLFV